MADKAFHDMQILAPGGEALFTLVIHSTTIYNVSLVYRPLMVLVQGP